MAAGLILAGQAIEISAAWGTFDTSFGSAGTFSDTGTNSYPNSVIVQPDGKILVTGYSLASNGKKRFMLRRWTANGAIDTTFGNNGAAVISAFINTNYDYAGWRMAMLTNGKIAVIGQANDKVGVWVVNSNGYGDTNFANNGQKFLTDYHYANGRIAAFGSKIILGVFSDDLNRVVIHRLNADGTDDTTFGSNGISLTTIIHAPSFSPTFEMIAETDTKKITIGGISSPSGGSQLKRFERLTPNGSTDLTFIPAQTTIPTAASFNGFARTSDGEYIYTDMQSVGVGFNARLYKLNANGTANINQPIGAANHLIGIQSNGRSIVGNGFTDNLDRHDTAFNFLDTAAVGYNADYYMGAVQPDDKLVVTARVNNRLTLFRWLAN